MMHLSANGKTILIAAVASTLTALVTIFTLRAFESPREIVLRGEGKNARFASYDDFVLSGRLQRSFVSSAPNNFIAAAESITPAVVNIKALTNGPNDNFWNDGATGTSSGSGVIISSDGYIVTNNHVVADASEIQVTLDDKREYTAKVVGTDPSTDLALLKVEAQRLTAVQFGNSDSIRIGEWVLAVGNPFNLESTVTAGIVSAKGRSINILEDTYSIESFIQTDAAVNPGNSGGALVNTNGELVGINTAIITKSGRYEGYSFAIPVNLVMKVIRDLKNYGIVQRGFMGIEIDELTPSKARSAGYNSMNGVFVYKISDKSAAGDAGIKQGDVIIGIDGNLIKNKAELLEQVARHAPGETVKIEYFRSGQRQNTNVTLRNKGNTTALVAPDKFDGDIDAFKRIGISDVRPLTQQETRKLGTRGVKVVSIERGSLIEQKNMEIGFVITHINEQKITSLDEAFRVFQTTRGAIELLGVYEEFPGEYVYKFVK
jgi:serine protease Do